MEGVAMSSVAGVATPELTGTEVLREPTRNHGLGFTAPERQALRLRGLLPPRIMSLHEQATWVLEKVRAEPTDLHKHVLLRDIQDTNEALFYRVAIDHLHEILPLIYTPVVGAACVNFSHIFRRPRGMFLSIDDAGHLYDILCNWPKKDVDVIVVTDGERILGLGDLGANGMGIPIGKLSLYVACGGVHPDRVLPITLDVGTNNEKNLADPFYIGTKQHRVRGAKYDEFVEEFVQAVLRRFGPQVLLQFEDFANLNAFPLLERYRDRLCCFNDDIQGTGAVAVAGLLAAIRVLQQKLSDQTIVFYGAGAAAVGIADYIVAEMVHIDGVTEHEGRQRVWLVDSRGLVTSSRSDLEEHKRKYAKDGPAAKSMYDVVHALKPTVLIGVSAQGNSFDERTIRYMASYCARPVVFALSNPTDKTEVRAEDAYAWTDGRCLYASGSPFPQVHLGDRLFVPRQCNNSYIFPGLGLGVVATKSRRVTDEMFLEAARVLAASVSAHDLKQGSLFPPLSAVRAVNTKIAAGVAKVAFDSGLATVPRPQGSLDDFIAAAMYDPVYGVQAPPAHDEDSLARKRKAHV